MTIKKPPIFSVIIPVYNRANVIARNLQSVLDQSFQDFEIIVVDDGSHDNPKVVIDSINDSRILYIHQDNKGAAAARNKGVHEAKGSYVAFLDSDDLWLPHHLSDALPVLQSAPNTCFYGQVIVERGNGVSFVKPPRGLWDGENISEYLLCDRGFFQTCSVVLPRDLAKLTLYDEKVTYGDDVDLAIKVSQAGGVFHFISGSSPSAIWFDLPNPDRLSAHIDPKLIENWLARINGAITKRAELGCMGWSVARGYAEQRKWVKALTLYLKALFYGCYTSKMAIVVFLQIILPRDTYRKFSDYLAKIGVKP